MTDAGPDSMPRPTRRSAQRDRQAHAREGGGQEPDERDRQLDDRQEAARVGCQAPDALGPATALVHQLVDPAAAQRDERDLRRHEHGVEQDEQDDDPDLEQRVAHQAWASPAVGPAAGASGCAASSPGAGSGAGRGFGRGCPRRACRAARHA